MPWAVPDHEVHLPIKERAVDVVLALTTRAPDDDPDTVARRAVGDDPASVAAVAAAAARLVSEEHGAVGRVVYPQMGGLTTDRASVMVVVEVETTAPDGASTTQRRTVDVRLERDGDRWVLDRVESVGGDPVARPDDLPAVAERVLDDPRIVLPDSARWDIHSGDVSTTLLAVMADLAERTPYGVVVLASGHPHDVFETGRTSSHTRGHAVDVHQLGDEHVVDGRTVEDGLTHEVTRWLYDHPDVSNLGSPWALDGFGGRSFTDAVHLDHLHVSTGR